MLRFVTFCVLVACASAMKLNFTDCAHKEFKSLDVAQCTTDPCQLHKGKEISVDAIITASENSKTATLKLSAVVSGLKIELPLDASQKDLCKSVKCPIVSGETYEAILKLTIPSVVPSGTEADLIAEVIDDKGGDIACARIHGKVID